MRGFFFRVIWYNILSGGMPMGMLRKKPISKVTFNEESKQFTVELGRHITSEDVFVGLVFTIEFLAEKLGVDKEDVWNQLAIYHKSRKE